MNAQSPEVAMNAQSPEDAVGAGGQAQDGPHYLRRCLGASVCGGIGVVETARGERRREFIRNDTP
jgi:hypothetical protein